MSFISTWLPNIVCTLAGCVISWGIGWHQGRKDAQAAETHTRMLTNLLIVMEERGYLKLVRNAKGEVTGGRAYEMKLGAGVITATPGGLEAEVIPGPGRGWAP